MPQGGGIARFPETQGGPAAQKWIARLQAETARQQMMAQMSMAAGQVGLGRAQLGLQEKQAFPLEYQAGQYGAIFPELYNLISGKLGQGRRNTMNQITGNMGKTMGAHLSRTNTSIPAGADVLARRYLSPLSQAMEMYDPAKQMGQAFGLTQQFAPFAQQGWGGLSAKRRPNQGEFAKNYMNRFWGQGGMSDMKSLYS